VKLTGVDEIEMRYQGEQNLDAGSAWNGLYAAQAADGFGAAGARGHQKSHPWPCAVLCTIYFSTSSRNL
jgi:hypothetical protein